jgi:hypothetical protein
VMVGPVVPVGPAVPAKSTPGPGFGGLDFAGPGGPSIPGGANQPENQKKEEAKTWEALLSALDNLPPTALAARRTGTELRVELWQPKTQSGGLASFINAGIGWFDSVLNRNPNPNPNSGYGRRFGRIRGG